MRKTVSVSALAMMACVQLSCTGDSAQDRIRVPICTPSAPRAKAAAIVVKHIEREAFLILTHDSVKTYMARKAADYDRWVGGMNKMHRHLTGESV